MESFIAFLRTCRFPRFFLLLVILGFSVGGNAYAASGDCATSPDIVNSTNRVNLETFVPDPVCWLQGTQEKVNSVGLIKWSTNIAIGLVVLAIGIAALGAPTNPAEFGKKVAIAALCFAMVQNYADKSGGAWMLSQALNDGWNAGYSTSAKVGQNMLNTNTQTQVENLGRKFGQYVVASAKLRGIKAQMIVLASNPAINGDNLDKMYDEIVKKSDLVTNPTGGSWLTHNASGIVYFLLLGLFTVFGVMVYSSGFLIIGITVMMPIIFASCAFGNWTPVLSVGKLGIGAIAGIVMLPIVVGLMVGTLLTSPIQTLNNSIESSIAQTKVQVDGQQATMNRCVTQLNVGECIRGATNGLSALSPAEMGKDVLGDSILGMGLGVISILAAFAMAMTQIRRVPALMLQVIGAAGGGGESSGAYSPPGAGAVAGAAVGAAIDVGAAVATGGGSSAAKLAVKGAQAVASRAGGGQSGPTVRNIGTVQREPKVQQLPKPK